MFRVGDRVRALRNAEGQYTEGNIYVVSRVYEGSIITELDDAGSRFNGWAGEYFELVEAGPPPVPPIEVTTYQIYYKRSSTSRIRAIVVDEENQIEAYKRALTVNYGRNLAILGVKKIKVKFPGVAAE